MLNPISQSFYTSLHKKQNETPHLSKNSNPNLPSNNPPLSTISINSKNKSPPLASPPINNLRTTFRNLLLQFLKQPNSQSLIRNYFLARNRSNHRNHNLSIFSKPKSIITVNFTMVIFTYITKRHLSQNPSMTIKKFMICI